MADTDEGTLKLATAEERISILCERNAKLADNVDFHVKEGLKLRAKLEVYRDIVDSLIGELRGSK